MIDLPVLAEDEVADVVRRIDEHRDRWIPRAEGFATLGVATYLDVMCGSQPEVDYYGRLDEQNDFLREVFGDVLDRVAAVLGEHFAAPTRFIPEVALPGFHVFEAGAIKISDSPSQHFDLQHRGLRWPFEVGEEALISFTLPLELPRLGGGLEHWDIVEQELRRLDRMGRHSTMEQLGRTKPKQFHPYSPGVMAVQLKPVMHRIAAIRERFPGDRRITLQGHGVRDRDTWVLYW